MKNKTENKTKVKNKEKKAEQKAEQKVEKNAEQKLGKTQIWVKDETLAYTKELTRLQVELLKFQKSYKAKWLKSFNDFEGRDAAGKGGTIKRIT